VTGTGWNIPIERRWER